MKAAVSLMVPTSPATPLRFERGDVVKIQRARLLAAMGEVACEHSAANVTVAQIVERAGVSRRTFYEIFTDVEDCLLAVLRDALECAQERVLNGWSSQGGWRERARRSLTELLGLFDEDPVLAQLLVVESFGVESLAADQRVLGDRLRVLDSLIDAIDESARRELPAAGGDTRLNAEGAIGGAFAVLYARIVRRTPGRLVELTSQLMSMLVLPYHGQAAARRELARPVPPPHEEPKGESEMRLRSDPFKDAGMRLTYRTTRVLDAIAEHPGSSNRQISKLAEISDQGQVSKLLARLERIAMIVNNGERHTKSDPNAWFLTSAGRQLIKSLRGHAETAPVEAR